MEKMNYSVKGIHDIGHAAEKLAINEVEARRIANWYSKHVDWVHPASVFVKGDRVRTLGTITTVLGVKGVRGIINLYGLYRGATVGCLLHELAHFGDLPYEDHGSNFMEHYRELLKWWDEFQTEMLPQKFVGSIFNVLDYITDLLDEGTPLTRKLIGEELVDEGVYSLENFNFCLDYFADCGFKVK